MRDVGARSKLRPSVVPGRLNTDMTKLMAVSIFVLCVFVCGVVVGLNFFELQEERRLHRGHDHAHGPLPPGVMARDQFENKFSQQRGALRGIKDVSNVEETLPPFKPEISQHDQGSATIIHAGSTAQASSPGCCNGQDLSCLACRAKESIMFFCSHQPSVEQCGSLPSLYLTNGAHVKHSAPGGMDSERITFSAWIYLRDNSATGSRTIVSNRNSGCSVSDSRHGFAFYINQPKRNDGSLNLVVASGNNMCSVLSTEINAVRSKVWVHVGFVLEQGPTGLSSAIYINGVKAASNTNQPKRFLAPTYANLYLGLTADGMDHLNGAVKDAILYKGAFESALLWPGPKSPPESGPIALLKPATVMYLSLESKLKGLVDQATSPQGQATFSSTRPGIVNRVLPTDPPGLFAKLKSVVVGGDSNPAPTPPAGTDGILVSESIRDLIEGNTGSITDPEIIAESDRIGRENALVVKAAMKHAYGSYERYAFGHDEVTPRSGKSKDPWGYHAVTLVDSLDTLWLMGMKDEFYRARDYVRDKLSFDLNHYVSVFETNIRDLGGLLAAYEFSGDKAFLNLAKDLGDRLAHAFDTPTGFPKGQVNLKTGVAKNGWSANALLAELGTMQIEFRNLAIHTGERKYADMVEKVYPVLRKQPNKDGLLPLYFSVSTGKPTNNHITFGAMGDSYYEYLLKVFLQGGKVEPELYSDYQAAMNGMIKHLIHKTRANGLTYVADMVNGSIKHKMDHLACFVPGMLALGAYHFPESPTAARDLKLAKQLLYTCYQMYERYPVGLSPEYVNFNVGGKDFDPPNNVAFYILRPETVESIFIMHQITKHPIYREWGHKIMQSLDKYCRGSYGYGAHPDVRNTKRIPDDKMESFFLAETLKYLYLLQSPDHPIDLKKYVFNTEAHPTRIFPDGWREKLYAGEAQ